MRILVLLGLVSLLFLAGCGGSTNQPPPSKSIPTISVVSPTSANAGGATFTLTINGTNFVAASVVNFGGMVAPTTFVSATQLNAAIPPPAIASIGMVAVTVTNPAPGGGTSNAVTFTITSGADLTPTINTLSPSSATFGGPAFTLSVFGDNFVASSVVRWLGSDRPTTFVRSTLVTAQIPASDIAATGAPAVTVFNPGVGSSNALTFTVTTGGLDPQSITVDPSGKFAYVANEGTNNVSMYTINPDTGTLVYTGFVAAGSSPTSVTVDPTSNFAYVANDGSRDISMYTVDAKTGMLTSRGTINSSRGVSVTVHPSGQFAYVANGCYQNSLDSVSMYAIDTTTGFLTLLETIPTEATGPSACSIKVGITIDPSGRFAYAASDGCGLDTYFSYISTYTINPTTGALTAVGESVGAYTCSSSLSVDPFSKFAYVPNDPNLSTYAIDAKTGALTLLGSIAAGSGPISSAVHPSARFVYVANSGSNNVSAYAINNVSGALTSIGTIAAGSSPSSIAIHPSGKFAYVTNSRSNNISMYSIDDATGALTLIGTIGT